MPLSHPSQVAISTNITNAETPNYKVKVVTFKETIKDKLEQVAKLPEGAGKAVWDILEDSKLNAFKAQEQTRMNDNGVNVTSEMTEMIHNAYQQQHVC